MQKGPLTLPLISGVTTSTHALPLPVAILIALTLSYHLIRSWWLAGGMTQLLTSEGSEQSNGSHADIASCIHCQLQLAMAVPKGDQKDHLGPTCSSPALPPPADWGR